MVLRIEHLAETDFTSDARLIDTKNSTKLDPVECPEVDEQIYIWRAPIGNDSKPITYWAGADGLVVAFVSLRRVELADFKAFEAIRAWSSPMARNSGLVRALMLAASEMMPLISDAEGMTPVAYAAWTGTKGFTRLWYDNLNGRIVEEEAIPEDEKFSRLDSATRWRLILDPRSAD